MNCRDFSRHADARSRLCGRPCAASVMTEIELKFQVAAARRAALAKAVATRTAQRVRLVAQYFDTADRRLARAQLALRVRSEGRHWVQTLKGAGDGLWQRLEHEVPLGVSGSSMPPVDPGLHDGTPAGQALRQALGDAPLLPIYATQVTRSVRLLRAAGCRVELAFDEGELLAGAGDAERRWPLCELEFELKSGDATAMCLLAARWVARFGLTLDVRSKSERGDRLARGQRAGIPAKAQPVELAQRVDSASALRGIVGNTLQQVLGNASDISDGLGSAEHVHQLRVGLRRLRTALRELGEALPQPDMAWQGQLQQLFAGLGGARDRDALAEKLLPALHRAGVPALQLPAAARHLQPVQILREPATTRLWLQLLAFAAQQGPSDEAFADLARRRLQQLHRQVLRDGRRFDRLDDAARHRLRKRVKRLRYLCEFAASQFPAADVKAFLHKLTPAQQALGEYNDICVARGLFGTAATADAQAMFALGWLARERDNAAMHCIASLRDLRRANAFW